MLELNACEGKVRLWESITDPEEEDPSEKQWDRIFEHTKNCKQCQGEIEKIIEWSNRNITPGTATTIFYEDVLPDLFGFRSERSRSDEREPCRCLVMSALKVAGTGGDPGREKNKIWEYFLKKFNKREI